jgi:hypothetical protein
MNFDGCRRKWLWHILRYYNGICLEVPRNIRENLSQESPPRAGFEQGPSRIQVNLLGAPHMRVDYYPWVSHKSGRVSFQFNLLSAYLTTLPVSTLYLYMVLEFQALRGYSPPETNKTPTDQCLLRYGRALHLAGRYNNTAVCASCTFVYLSLQCVLS